MQCSLRPHALLREHLLLRQNTRHHMVFAARTAHSRS